MVDFAPVTLLVAPGTVSMFALCATSVRCSSNGPACALITSDSQPGDGTGNRQYQTFHVITFLPAAATFALPEVAIISSSALAVDRLSAASRDPMVRLAGAVAAAAD